VCQGAKGHGPTSQKSPYWPHCLPLNPRKHAISRLKNPKCTCTTLSSLVFRPVNFEIASTTTGTYSICATVLFQHSFLSTLVASGNRKTVTNKINNCIFFYSLFHIKVSVPPGKVFVQHFNVITCLIYNEFQFGNAGFL